MSPERLAQLTAPPPTQTGSTETLIENNKVLIEAIAALQEGMADLIGPSGGVIPSADEGIREGIGRGWPEPHREP